MLDCPLADYGRPIQSEVLEWLPVTLGVCSAVVSALLLCPVPPRTRAVTSATALVVSLVYVTMTLVIATATLLVANRIVGLHVGARSVGHFLGRFCDLVAWGAPVACFLARESFWAVVASVILATKSVAAIVSWHGEAEESPLRTECSATSEGTPLRTEVPMVAAALLLHVAAASAVGGFPRLTSVLAAVAVLFVARRRAEVPRYLCNRSIAWRSCVGVGLAAIFVWVSFAPYLIVKPAAGQPALDADERLGAKSLAKSPLGVTRSSEPRSVIQRVWVAFFGNAATGPHGEDHGRDDRVGEPTADSRPYPLLQALFGNQPLAPPKPARYGNAVVAGDSFPGMILRPEILEHVILVPPPPTRRVLGGKPAERRTDTQSVPFYGAYWFFRTVEETLPADALESRGDPASTEFRSTDLTPITMEARQNFGREIDVSCCGIIEIHILNGDRRPNTVAIELVLRNTRLPGQPLQTLGMQPVTSTLRWHRGDQRPPVPEVLSFRVPSASAIPKFDEAIMRFHLSSRYGYSAKISIRKFRFIPPRL